MERHYQTLVRLTDQLVPTVLSLQNQNINSPEYGAFMLPEKGFGEPGTSGNCADILLSCYYAPDSVYYQNTRVFAAAEMYLDNLLRMQNSDGTLDLRETNYHDATYAGFTVQVLGYTWKMLEKRAGDLPAEKQVREKLRLFLERAAHGMCTGGFHTPNHRWVLSSALSLCGNILDDGECRHQASLYLAEGIDCDDNGEFTEHSAGIYNVVNDRSLIIVSRERDMPGLLEYVRRNLQMMYAYIEPDFSVFTLNSRRQDNGKAVYPTNYYDCYLYMALLTRDCGFAWMADKILSLMEQDAARARSPYEVYQNMGLINHLSHYLAEDELRSFEPMLEKPVFDCSRFFQGSNIVRMRRSNISMTLLGNNPSFCVMQKGHTKLKVRLAASFYAKGVFATPSIERLEDRVFHLSYSYCWGYTRPFPNGSSTCVWEEMDHASREHVNMMTLEMDITARWLDEGGMRLEISVNGVKNLPVRIEIIFDAGGVLEAPGVILDGMAGTSAILTGSEASYCCQGETFSLVCPYEGQQHTYTYGMRGAQVNQADAFTLYLTAVGETKRVIEIR